MIWLAVPALMVIQEVKPPAPPISTASKSGVTVELWSVQKFSTKQALIKTSISGTEKARYSTVVVALQGETANGEWINLKQIELDASKAGGEWAESINPEAFLRWTGGTRLEIVSLEQSPLQVRLDATAKEAQATPKGKQAAGAKNTRYAFKDFQLGMFYRDFTREKEYRTERDFAITAILSETIANAECTVTLNFADYGKGQGKEPGNRLQLDYINVTADKSQFPTILAALKQKYGAPKASRSITKSNAMGATFHGLVVVWNNGGSSLVAEELGSNIDECRILWSAIGLGKSKAAKASSEKAAADL